MEERIQNFFRNKMPEVKNLIVTGLKKNTAGFSYETAFFHAEWIENEEQISKDFVIRAEPKGGGLVEPYDVRIQYWILKSLQGTPIPVPKVYWLETDLNVIGSPFFIMDMVEGEIPEPWAFFKHPYYRDSVKREQIGKKMVEVLAHIHNVDWKALGLGEHMEVPAEGKGAALSEIEKWWKIIKEFRVEPEPILADTYMWLKENMPNTKKLTLVHGDYRLGNFIWNDDRISAVLDWEMAHIGDPMCDLGWFFMKHWTSGKPGEIHWVLKKDDIYRYYENITGERIDDEILKYWIVMNNFKNFGIMICAAKVVLNRKSDDLRLLTFSVMPFHCLQEIMDMINF
ncbi:MAG: phosphotransferase family protein [Desulfobacterales bacterium]|jgi:aminoglycoside phosphotransferase (APT) family kinase protein|nr:phosphotransferase family protein [Desulfobacterales bacterium]